MSDKQCQYYHCKYKQYKCKLCNFSIMKITDTFHLFKRKNIGTWSVTFVGEKLDPYRWYHPPMIGRLLLTLNGHWSFVFLPPVIGCALALSHHFLPVIGCALALSHHFLLVIGCALALSHHFLPVIGCALSSEPSLPASDWLRLSSCMICQHRIFLTCYFTVSRKFSICFVLF